MAFISKSAQINMFISGELVETSLELFDIEIKATFDKGNVQASIEQLRFSFVGRAYQVIKEHIASGLTGGVGIFEGLPFRLEAVNIDSNFTIFDGYLDFQQGVIDDPENAVFECNIQKINGLNSIDLRLQSNTFLILKNEGFITSANETNIDYIVEPFDKATQALQISILLFNAVKTLRDAIKSIAEQANITGSFLGSVFASAGAGIYAPIQTAINLAYYITVVAQIIDLTRDFVNTFNPPIRTNKSINLKEALEQISSYLGYDFNTTLPIDNIYFMPSNPNGDEFGSRGFLSKVATVEDGTPQPRDYGYLLSEFATLCADLFNGVFGVVDGKLQLHTELSDFWKRNASFELPDIIRQPFNYNTDELNANVLIAFNTDTQDLYSITDKIDNVFQIVTNPINKIDPKKNTIRNLNEVRFPVALGSRKDELNGVERFLSFIGGFIDGLTNTVSNIIPFLNIRTNIKASIQSKIGVLKVSQNNYALPKLIYLDANGRIPSNHRDLLSARASWFNGHNEKSFIFNNYRRQRKNFENVDIPFGFVDFLETIENSNFTTNEGQNGKLLEVNWQHLMAIDSEATSNNSY